MGSIVMAPGHDFRYGPAVKRPLITGLASMLTACSSCETSQQPTADVTADVAQDTIDTEPGADVAPDTSVTPDVTNPPEDVQPDAALPTDTTDATPPDTTDTTDATTPDTIVPVDPADLSDDIFGVTVPRSTSWWVNDGRIFRNRDVTRLRGINWFGLETADRALHGTWYGRKVEDFLAELRTLGFDSLRIPVSPQSINAGFDAASWSHNAYQSGPTTTGREQLDKLLVAAGDAGFSVLLDFHTCHPDRLGQQLPGRPDGCDGYTLADWKTDLTTLATLASAHPHVVGIDLCNEPHALTWAEWKSSAEQGAEAVLRANPRLLIIVEGVAGRSNFGAHYPFWGENLTDAATSQPAIPPSRLVFSPHVYGPGIADQSYFAAAGFPANMPAIWTTHFGHLVPRFAFAVGEFGGFYDDAKKPGEVAWNEAFVAYLATLDRGQPTSFYYWAVNPNSGDTGGLYEDDWSTIVMRRVALLSPLLSR